jgi:hypothetical protein
MESLVMSGWHKDDVPQMRETLTFLRRRLKSGNLDPIGEFDNTDDASLQRAYSWVIRDLERCVGAEERITDRESPRH